MRRALITTGTTAAGIVLLLSLKPHESTLAGVSSQLSTGDSPATRPSQGSTQDSTGSTSSGSTTSGSSSGAFSGETVRTRFGPVQVKITVKNGKLTKAEALQYPDRDHHSSEISSYAVPTLNEAAVQAGSANLDNISGATYTSQAYISSLQSALDKAGVR